MKTDVQILHECLMDYSYKNKIHLDIILNKIEDKKLVNGFLIFLFIGREKLEIEKSDIPIEAFGLPDDNKSLLEDHTYYKEKMRKCIQNSQEKNKIYLDLLISLKDIIISEDATNFEKKLSKLSKNQLVGFKDYLVEKEMYEYIGYITKYL